MPRKPPEPLLRYSNLAIQMGLIIGLFVWGGDKLDERNANQTPVYTIVLSLLGIGISLYLVIRDIMRNQEK